MCNKYYMYYYVKILAIIPDYTVLMTCTRISYNED